MSSSAGGAGGIPRGVVSVDRRSVGPRARRSSRGRRPADGPVGNPLALRFTGGASGRPSPPEGKSDSQREKGAPGSDLGGSGVRTTAPGSDLVIRFFFLQGPCCRSQI